LKGKTKDAMNRADLSAYHDDNFFTLTRNSPLEINARSLFGFFLNSVDYSGVNESKQAASPLLAISRTFLFSFLAFRSLFMSANISAAERRSSKQFLSLLAGCHFNLTRRRSKMSVSQKCKKRLLEKAALAEYSETFFFLAGGSTKMTSSMHKNLGDGRRNKSLV